MNMRILPRIGSVIWFIPMTIAMLVICLILLAIALLSECPVDMPHERF